MAFAALLALPLQAQAQTVQTLISNTGQTDSGQNTVGALSGNNWAWAQKFTTGDEANGYTLSAVDIRLGSIATNDDPIVSIYPADTSGLPGDSLYVLADPSSFTSNDLNTFTAQMNATLGHGTDYFVVCGEHRGGFRSWLHCLPNR